ncbi:MarR family transcriptional regulator [Actinoplanes sp. NPDC051851]|uniref:MarR family winged helix-turn-helix transcriptional regulator n=1 Tax=Actinoplanes sp. NPDC051851 TaxID=3154753 RepID=UPI003448236B
MTDEVDEAQARWRLSRPEIGDRLPGAFVRILRINNLVRGLTDTALSGYGVDRAGFEVLAVLARAGEPVSPARIADELHLTRAAVTKRLRQVEATEMVRRRPHHQDGRSVVIELTGRGSATVFPALDEIVRLENAWLGELPETDRAALDTGLRRLLAVLVEEEGKRAEDG